MFYKSDLDNITTIEPKTASTSLQVTDYAGIKYFRNLESLTIRSSQNNVILDLSENKKLSSLTFTLATIKLKELNISNTQLTSLTIPTGLNTTAATTYLTTLTAKNTALQSLDISKFNGLTSVDLSGSANLTSLTLMTAENKSLTSLNLEGCSGLSETYTEENPLNLRAYTGLNPSNVTLTGSGLVANKSVRFNFDSIKTLEIDAEGKPVGKEDLAIYEKLETLTVHNSPKVDITVGNLPTTLKKLIVDGEDYDTELVISKENTALNWLDISFSGISKIDFLGDCDPDNPDPTQTIAPNLVTFKAWKALALEEIDLSWHTKLSSAIYPTAKESRTGSVGFGIVTSQDLIPDNNLIEICQNNKLRVIKLRGCTGLSGTLYLTDNGESNYGKRKGGWRIFSNIEEVDLSGCENITTLYCMNTLLTSLNLSGCKKLRYISIDQGKLTGLNNDINMAGCDGLVTFIAKRHKWENLDFLLKPVEKGGNRSIEEIFQLNQIQVNGGSYTLQASADNTDLYIRNDKDGTPMKYTTQLKEIDLSNLNPGYGRKNPNIIDEVTGDSIDGTGEGFKKLLVDCNMLRELDLSVIGGCLQELQCTNNMLTTLDLTKLNTSVLKLSSCNWKYQVGWLDAEIVKGSWNGKDSVWMNDEGKMDWIALHMPNGGFTHRMDNDFGLYTNLYDARYDNNAGRNPVASEAQPWMAKVTEVDSIVGKKLDGYEKFEGTYPCPNNHEGQHIFLHSQKEIEKDFGAYKDQDLTGMVLTYKYNTGFRQKKIENTVSPNDSTNYSLDDTGLSDAQKEEAHIIVRMHIFPYLLNINPVSKNQFSKEEQDVDYYSSTIYLDYDALIPKGVTVYTVSGIKEKSAFEVRGKKLDGQLSLVPFGGDDDPQGNRILPAFTPVYVRAREPQPAGLYEFVPIREVEVYGWENLRGTTGQEDYILHGMENLNNGNVKSEYVAEYNVALNRKNATTNVLRGWLGTRYEDVYPEVDINHENFNKMIPGEHTSYEPVASLTVLTLGIQNQTSAWPVIGFWPFRGTSLSPHRCYIPYGEVYSTSQSGTSAKGFNFFFTGEEFDAAEGGVTGIETVSDEKAAAAEGWYDIQGVRLSEPPTQRGIYIFNGRKVAIK